MRQDIVDKVSEHLKLISVANGNHFDLSKNFFEWRDKPLNDDEFPACILEDATGTYDEDSGHTLNFTVVAVVSGDVNTEVATQTRLAMQDVAYAVRDAIEVLGLFGTMKKTEMASDDKEKRYIAGSIHFEVQYTAGEWEI